MAKRSSSIGLLAFVWILTGMAAAQDVREMRAADSLGKAFDGKDALPDDPSAQFIQQKQSVNFISEDALSSKKRRFATDLRPGEFSRSVARLSQGDSNIFNKYLSVSTVGQRAQYSAATQGGLVARATGAASAVFLTRNEAGKAKLNTAYFLRALTYVAADTASRPYWKRSRTGPLSDFGSTMGNAAGMNVLHEFAPALQQITKEHTPQFVYKLEQRISRQ